MHLGINAVRSANSIAIAVNVAGAIKKEGCAEFGGGAGHRPCRIAYGEDIKQFGGKTRLHFSATMRDDAQLGSDAGQFFSKVRAVPSGYQSVGVLELAFEGHAEGSATVPFPLEQSPELFFLRRRKERAEQLASCGNQQSGPHGETVYHSTAIN